MGDQEVGIKIVAKDFASKSFVGIGKAAKTTTGTIRKMAGAVGTTAKSLGMFSVMANQAFELWSKVRERILNSAKAAIDASMQFRSSVDPMRKWWEDQAKGIEETKARIGDVLLPILKGVSEAFNEVSGSLSKWLVKNKEWLQSGFIAALESLPGILTPIIFAFSATYTTMLRIVQGSVMVAGAFKEMAAGVFDSMATMAYDMSQLAQRMGLDDLEQKLLGASVAMVGARENAKKGAGDSADFLQSIDSQIKGVERTAISAVNTIERFANRASTLARDAAASDTGAGGGGGGGGGGGKTEAEILAARESTLAKLNGIVDKYVTEQEAKYAKDATNFKQSEESKKLIVQDVSNAMAAATNAWASSVVDSQNTAKDNAAVVFKSIVASAVSAAQKMIMTNAVLAATSAAPGAAASSGIAAPIVVPAVMATIVGIVQAYMTKMALGGEVRGGVPGRDSVPALLKPGELVLNESQARRAKKEGKTQAPVSVSVTLHQSSLIPDADMSQRAVDAIGPAIEAAIREGRLQVGVT